MYAVQSGYHYITNKFTQIRSWLNSCDLHINTVKMPAGFFYSQLVKTFTLTNISLF